MSIRLWKEVRALSLAWIVALFLPIVAMKTDFLVQQCWIFLCGAGYLGLGAMSFGYEINHGTLPLLLSQPVSRRRLWLEKTAVLAVVMGVTFLAHVVVCILFKLSLVLAFEILLAAVCAFLVCPAMTLIVKNTLAAAVFTPIVLAVVGLGVFGITDLLYPARVEAMNGGDTLVYFQVIPAVAAAGVIFVIGYFIFQRLECREFLGREVGLAWLLAPGRWLLTASGPGTWWSSLVLKELQLHRLNFFLAFLFVLACLASAFHAWLKPVLIYGDDFFYRMPFLIYWAIAPLTIGAVPIAEERQLGVLEWQMAMPPARGKQWAIKAIVTYLVGVAWLVILPVACLIGLYRPLQIPFFENDLQVAWTCVAALGLMTLAFYTSSLCATTLRTVLVTLAALISVSLSMAAFFWIPSVLDYYTQFLWRCESEQLLKFLISSSPFGVLFTISLFTAMGIGVISALILGLCRVNYLANDPRRWFVKTQWVIVVLGVDLLVNSLIYFSNLLAEFKITPL
jgi:hypothetical protein